jgi:hypothetical protein
MPEHRVSIASPPDRNKLVAMIDFGGEQWAELNQDSGQLQLEIYPRRDGEPWLFSLTDAVSAIQLARARLLNVHEQSDESAPS